MKRKSRQPPTQPKPPTLRPPTKQTEHAPAPGFVGRPLDGSQFHDVIEEQQYAEQRPTPEGR